MYFMVAVLLAVAPAEDKSKDEWKIQGTWTAVSREMDGKKTPEADLKVLKVTIKDGTMTITDGKKKHKITYKLDPSKKPKAIDLTNVDGKDANDLTRAIYELDDVNLKLCWSEKAPEQARPTKFASD